MDCQVVLGPDLGWTDLRLEGGRIRFKGHVHLGMASLEGEEAARHVAGHLLSARGDEALKAQLNTLYGHYAFVLEQDGRLIAGVDRIRSTALLLAGSATTLMIDDRGRRLVERLGLGAADIDPDQLLAMAMAGYTIGDGTLYRPIRQLRPGEAVVVDKDGQRVLRWFVYDAWNVVPMADAEGAIDELLTMLVKRLAASAKGRQIAVPLSAGLDSRFVASGLRMAGYENVLLFSYGRPGNHEAVAAEKIAQKLGYPWHFVEFTTQSQRAMYADPAHIAHWARADTLTTIPFIQDWTALKVLATKGLLQSDAIIVNGNSGDYITGAHAPVTLIDAPEPADPAARKRMAVDAVLSKHFRLWDAMARPENDRALSRLLGHEARAAGVQFGPDERLYGIHEMLEYQDRQSKYVVSGQRTYEGLGYAWRLPLWDDEIIEFFRNAPPELKRRQTLYRRSLERMNWGGVWRDIPVNAKTITPAWIRPIRFAAKLALSPFGKRKWHRFERRAFTWWMDPLRASVIVPYRKALMDRAGARHAGAWIADAYLTQHGIDTSALPPAADEPETTP
jgi:asparagine synthase (glutamine-hydrolysing)